MTPSSRLVRVFISSTFRDFIGERDELVKKVFPELRRRCRTRFVELLEVDLRWGITEEQSRQGSTLGICLREIDQCRPSAAVFFVGLLGERYGWVPAEDFYPRQVVDDPQMAWVREHVGGRSVTELEILHGVLNNPTMQERAFFFFRRDGYELRHWPAIHAAQPDLVPEDFRNDLEPDPVVSQARQASLKHRIRESGMGCAPREYETPRELAGLVLETLWDRIDRAFPASEVPDALEQETIDHRVFCESRTRAYVERKGLFAELDAHAEGEGPIGRVVLGASGGGKSALLAAWLDRQVARVVFAHFVGATPQSVSAEGLLRHFFGTLRRRGVLGREERLPQDRDGLVAAVPGWLERLSGAGGGVILLDALNQLASALDRELDWWPERWPDNVRMVFSTLPGDVLRRMERRGWINAGWSLTVPPLHPREKRSVLDLYLRRFSRTLGKPLVRRLLDAPQTANPLFLRTVLDELRLRSRHEDLARNLRQMLECTDPPALFVHVLRNLERDFTPAEHPGLVHRALGLMGVGRRGLSEGELLELLSSSPQPGREPLARHYWAPLYLALEDSLVSREGQLSFFHDYLREAVWREYLDEAHERETAHGRLAETATRWQDEGAFGASLRAYGFQHGIGHLLALGRSEESRDLLLDRTYQKQAVCTLRNPEPIQRDVAAVRCALVRGEGSDPLSAAGLAEQALSGRGRLTEHLRRALDDAAWRGDWEEVVALAAAAEEDSLRLLLAFRAILRGGGLGCSREAAELRILLERWAVTVGKPEWRELIDRFLPAGPGTMDPGDSTRSTNLS